MEPIPYQEISNLALEVLHQRVTNSLQILAMGVSTTEESTSVEQTIGEFVSVVEKILDSIRLYSFTKENCFALWESFCNNPVLLDLILESTDIFFLRLNQVNLEIEPNEDITELGTIPVIQLATMISNVITMGRPKPEAEQSTFGGLLKPKKIDNQDYIIANPEFFSRGMDADEWYNLFCCNPWLLFIIIVKTSNANLNDFFGTDNK